MKRYLIALATLIVVATTSGCVPAGNQRVNTAPASYQMPTTITESHWHISVKTGTAVLHKTTYRVR